MTAGTPEEQFREKLAEWIGYEMLCEGKKTGTQISHGVAARIRSPLNRELVLGGLGLEFEEGYLDPNKRGNVAVLWPLAIEEIAAPGKLDTWQRGYVVHPRGEATTDLCPHCGRGICVGCPLGEATDA